MASKFQKAQKTDRKARVAIEGPTGSGKTLTALLVASSLGSRIAVVDTENKSASLYADRVAFDSMNLDEFSPRTYVEAIHAAEQEGYEVLIIDSLSHAWMGKGGALEMVDQAAARSKTGNTFSAWREVTPEQTRLVDAMIQCKCHLIVTMRSKMEYVLDKDERTGKTVPRKVGMAAIQRDGIEYEFDIVGEMTSENKLIITKTRYSALANQVIEKPGAELGFQIKSWLSDGVRATEGTVPSQVLPPVTTVAPAPSEEPDPIEEENLPTPDPAFDTPIHLAGQEVPLAQVLGVPEKPTAEDIRPLIEGTALASPTAEASDELYRIRTKYGWSLQQTKALARGMFKRRKFEELDSSERQQLAMEIEGIVASQASQKQYEVKSS